MSPAPTLEDALRLLRAVTGDDTVAVSEGADRDGDGRYGLRDVLATLQVVAGLR